MIIAEVQAYAFACERQKHRCMDRHVCNKCTAAQTDLWADRWTDTQTEAGRQAKKVLQPCGIRIAQATLLMPIHSYRCSHQCKQAAGSSKHCKITFSRKVMQTARTAGRQRQQAKPASSIELKGQYTMTRSDGDTLGSD